MIAAISPPRARLAPGTGLLGGVSGPRRGSTMSVPDDEAARLAEAARMRALLDPERAETVERETARARAARAVDLVVLEVRVMASAAGHLATAGRLLLDARRRGLVAVPGQPEPDELREAHRSIQAAAGSLATVEPMAHLAGRLRAVRAHVATVAELVDAEDQVSHVAAELAAHVHSEALNHYLAARALSRARPEELHREQEEARRVGREELELGLVGLLSTDPALLGATDEQLAEALAGRGLRVSRQTVNRCITGPQGSQMQRVAELVREQRKRKGLDRSARKKAAKDRSRSADRDRSRRADAEGWSDS